MSSALSVGTASLAGVRPRSARRLRLDSHLSGALRPWSAAFRRVAPLAAFALLTGFQALIALPAGLRLWAPGGLTAPAALDAAAGLLAVGFCAQVAVTYVARPAAAGAQRSLATRAVALYGSFVLLATPPLLSLTGHLPAPAPAAQLLLATALMCAGSAWALFGVAHLRSSFSLVPEARRLVTGGPYRLVRHPVYLGETVCASGLLLARPGLLMGLAVATFLLAQLRRMSLEDRLLRASFPGYDAWAARTRRLIPGLY
jgi:protein-S-isoprenylcysteine O-methyltransferase Ste14